MTVILSSKLLKIKKTKKIRTKSCTKSTRGEQALKAHEHNKLTLFYLLSLLKSHSVLRIVVPFSRSF